MKYSVIIPVYRAETTIEKCLRSLLSQPHDGVELLLVNDGSPDRSGEICERFAAQYDCIRYFCKENGGVSTARNLALDNARGEYVLFVDSDDYVREDYFTVIDREIAASSPDMLVWASQTNLSEKPRGIGCFYASSARESAKLIAPHLRANRFSQLWARAFKRELIEENKIRFCIGLNIAEDLVFIVEYLCSLSSIAAIDEPLYVQKIDNVQSLSKKKRPDLADSLLKADELMFSSIKKAHPDPLTCRQLEGALAWLYYRSVYSSCKELQKFELSASERRTKIREICRMYAQEHVRPHDWKCALIALPVRLRMSYVLDLLAKRAAGN